MSMLKSRSLAGKQYRKSCVADIFLLWPHDKCNVRGILLPLTQCGPLWLEDFWPKGWLLLARAPHLRQPLNHRIQQ